MFDDGPNVSNDVFHFTISSTMQVTGVARRKSDVHCVSAGLLTLVLFTTRCSKHGPMFIGDPKVYTSARNTHAYHSRVAKSHLNSAPWISDFGLS